MRRAALALLLFAAGCVSSGSHRIRIRVIELVRVQEQQIRSGNPIVQLTGPHYLHLRIDNDSQQNITIHSIHLEPDAPETHTDDPPESIERTIAPGGYELFDMYLNVYADRNAAASQSRLDYVKLTMGCSDETSDFFETGSYPVTRQRLGS